MMSQTKNKITRSAMGLYLSCFVGMLCQLLGCQQSQISFTQVQPPILAPASNLLANTPRVNPVQLPDQQVVSRTRLTTAQGRPYELHGFEADQSDLMRISLVAISPQSPYRDVDILAQAFNEKTLHLIATSPLNCAESLNTSVSMHAVRLTITCPAHVWPEQILSAYWHCGALTPLDIDKVARTLKLNKHINAFSGAEIEQAWRETILGKTHPYNRALNNRDSLGHLNQANLSQLQTQAFNQSQWHIFINQPLSPQRIAQTKELMGKLLDTQRHPVTSPPDTGAPTEKTRALASIPATKDKPNILYLIDAPGTVQTQVRIGYQVHDKAEADNQTLACHSLAPLLGRSYSGRLFYDLREKRGLTYGIYANCLQAPLSKTFKIQGATALRHTGAFIVGILDHLSGLTEQAVSQEELDSVKTYLIGQHLMNTDSSVRRQASYIQALTKNQKINDKTAQLERINLLGTGDIKSMASALFSHPPNIVIRGDGDKIRQDLAEKLPDWRIVEYQLE